MRKIVKGPEPSALTEYRAGRKPGVPDPDYEGFPRKDLLRKSIVEEQRGLCCYCMRRIKPDKDKMKIEHCRSQQMYPEEQLNYRNLLGACKGGERPNSRDQHCDTEKSSQSLSSKGEKVHQYHCDTKKGSQSLSFNPADPHFDIEATIKYLGDGEISSSNAEINRELGEAVLNLNLPMLKSNRKAVLDGFRLALKLKPGKKLDEAKELAKWDGSQPKQLPEYAAVVACYLRKKLRQK